RIAWNSVIQVPFSPETTASGIGDTGLFRACWYRREFSSPTGAGQWLLLHFGAVDHRATVWVNGSLVARHEGGYTPFTCDVTTVVGDDSRCEIIVRAEDDPADLEKSRGKQDWQPLPHSIWYPRSIRISQTVWVERVAATPVAQTHSEPH